MGTQNQTETLPTYEPGKVYPVTEVLSWWMTDVHQKPEWLPIMGPLHQDREFFDIHELHYHVDPRFLEGRQASRALDAQERDRLNGRQAWHPAFWQLASWFPYTDNAKGALAFKITDKMTKVTDRWLYFIRREPTAWGLARIQSRTRRRVCRATLEIPVIDRAPENDAFREMRRHYGRRCSDICPHRGYDLRNIPIDASGHRQCPLHQLRVRAPRARRQALQAAGRPDTAPPIAPPQAKTRGRQ